MRRPDIKGQFLRFYLALISMKSCNEHPESPDLCEMVYYTKPMFDVWFLRLLSFGKHYLFLFLLFFMEPWCNCVFFFFLGFSEIFSRKPLTSLWSNLVEQHSSGSSRTTSHLPKSDLLSATSNHDRVSVPTNFSPLIEEDKEGSWRPSNTLLIG